MSKEKINVSLGEKQVRKIEQAVGNKYENRSKAVRDLVEKGFAYNDLERERDRLRKQLAATNRRQEDVTELVEYVEEERDLRRDRRQRADAPVWRRAKWWVFGRTRDQESE